jgi:hypothetical protein
MCADQQRLDERQAECRACLEIRARELASGVVDRSEPGPAPARIVEIARLKHGIDEIRRAKIRLPPAASQPAALRERCTEKRSLDDRATMKFGATQIEPRQVRALEIAAFETQGTTGRGEQSLHVFTCESGLGDGMNARGRRRRIERHE